jgi:hypothetical protein
MAATPVVEDQEPAVLMEKAIKNHKEWMRAQQRACLAHADAINKSVLGLSSELQSATFAREKPHKYSVSLCALRVKNAAKKVSECVDQFNSWEGNLAGTYQNIAGHVRCAAMLLVHQRMELNFGLRQLLKRKMDAQTVLKFGVKPEEALVKKLNHAHDKLVRAQVKVNDAEHSIKNARLRRPKDPCDAAERVLKAAKEEARKQAKPLEALWTTVYELGSLAFPDLPGKALELMGSDLLDAQAANLLAPTRLSMYEDKKNISTAGEGSRNSVFYVKYNNEQVCVKEFKLGAGRSNVHAFQRELRSLSRLEHENVVRARCFFLEQESSNLYAYVEYKYYPEGSLDKWLKAERRGIADIRSVLFGALKGLEHGEFTCHFISSFGFTHLHPGDLHSAEL